MVETRLLNGGINTDDAESLLGATELLNAVNVRTNTSSTQSSQAAQFIEGNVEIQSVTNLLAFDPSEGKQSYELIGKTADEVTGMVYMFFCHVKAVPPVNGLKHCIVSYDPSTDVAKKILTNQMVGAALEWTQNLFIDCAVAANKLFWVDPTPRYLDLSVDYSTAYTAPFDNSVLSLVTEPGYVPLVVTSTSEPTAAANNLQTSPTQYTYRFRNTAGFTSVLSPYSLTNLPQRESELSINPLAGNAVTLTMPLTQKIPIDWEQVELVVRYTDGNQFYVIKQYNRSNPDDFSAVSLHIAGAQPLTFTKWTGVSIYTLDSNTIGKQFDSVPIEAKSLAFMANRMFLGSITEGYDTPVDKPEVTVTQNGASPSGFLVIPTVSYMLIGKEKDQNNYYVAVLYIDTTDPTTPVYRFLPKQYGIFTFSGYAGTFKPGITPTPPNSWDNVGTINGGLLTPPRYLSYDSCVTTKNQLDLGSTGVLSSVYSAKIMLQEAHDKTIEFENGGTGHMYLLNYFDINIVKTSPSNTERCFFSNSTYKLGIDWYDSALRKCGSATIAELNMPSMGNLIQSLTVSKPVGTPPAFATKYALTLSKSSKNPLVQFVAGAAVLAYKSKDGTLEYVGYNNLKQYVPKETELYATAIPLNSLARYGYGYDYKQGDFVEFNIFYDVFPIQYPPLQNVTAYIKGVQDGYLLISYIDNPFLYSIRVETLSATTVTAGSESATIYKQINQGLTSTWVRSQNDDGQCLCVVSIIRPISASVVNQYEVAAFGDIVNGAYGTYYNQANPLLAVIKGDYFPQQRTADAGGWNCLSITPNEKTALVDCNDLGRIAPIDNIGQQVIPTGFRWSNTNKIGAAVSGYASYDYADFAAVDETAGGITKLLPITKGVSEGGQLLILCDSNSFSAFVGKSQLFGADQTQAAITSTAETVGDINPITGGWGCQSPRSAVYYKGLAFFADVRNKSLIQFGGNGAIPVSRNKTTRLFKQLFSRALNVAKVSGAINPYTFEYMLFVPSTNPSAKANLPSTTLENPLDAYYNDSRVWIYDWTINKITGSWQTTDEMWNVGDKVFGWSGKLWQEFVGQPGVYNGTAKNAMIVIPFNGNYPLVKRMMSIALDCDVAPTQTWVVADGAVSTASEYEARETDLLASIGGNRLSNNAATTAEFNINFAKGDRPRAKVGKIVLIWSADFHCVSASLTNQPSSGHNTNKQ